MSDASQAVFLSYASQDADAARRICEALRAVGVEVWFDQNELVGGDAWDAKIRRQIGECALFVPIISANTQARREGYFRIEWRLAAQRTHAMADGTPFLLPVVIDDTRDAVALVPGEFRGVQWTQLPRGEPSARFCAHVQRLLAGGSVTEASRASAGHSLAPARERPRVARSLAVAIAAGGVLLVAGGWWWARQPSRAAGEMAQTVSVNSGPQETLVKVRRLRAKIDVTRAELEAASAMLELADRQQPNHVEIWAEWSLVDGRFVNEFLDRSDARRDAVRQRALRAFGLAPESPAARLAQASALVVLNRGDPAALAQARALLEPLATQPNIDPDALVLLSFTSRERRNPEPSFQYLDRLEAMPGGAARAHYERVLGFVYGERWAAAEIEIDRALAQERATMFLMWKAYIQMMWHGDVPTARQTLKDIPVAMLQEDFPATACFFTHLWAKDWDRALAVMRAVPRDYLDSGALSGPTGYFKGWALARAGKAAAAETEFRAAMAVLEEKLKAKPNARNLLVAKALVQVGLVDREAAARTRRLVVELYGDRPESWMDNFLTAELLPPDEAIQDFARQTETSAFVTGARLRLDPYLEGLRSHPKFAELLARVDADPRLSPAAAGRRDVDATKARAPRPSEKSLPAPLENQGAAAGTSR